MWHRVGASEAVEAVNTRLLYFPLYAKKVDKCYIYRSALGSKHNAATFNYSEKIMKNRINNFFLNSGSYFF